MGPLLLIAEFLTKTNIFGHHLGRTKDESQFMISLSGIQRPSSLVHSSFQICKGTLSKENKVSGTM